MNYGEHIYLLRVLIEADPQLVRVVRHLSRGARDIAMEYARTLAARALYPEVLEAASMALHGLGPKVARRVILEHTAAQIYGASINFNLCYSVGCGDSVFRAPARISIQLRRFEIWRINVLSATNIITSVTVGCGGAAGPGHRDSVGGITVQFSVVVPPIRARSGSISVEGAVGIAYFAPRYWATDLRKVTVESGAIDWAGFSVPPEGVCMPYRILYPYNQTLYPAKKVKI